MQTMAVKFPCPVLCKSTPFHSVKARSMVQSQKYENRTCQSHDMRGHVPGRWSGCLVLQPYKNRLRSHVAFSEVVLRRLSVRKVLKAGRNVTAITPPLPIAIALEFPVALAWGMTMHRSPHQHRIIRHQIAPRSQSRRKRRNTPE